MAGLFGPASERGRVRRDLCGAGESHTRIAKRLGLGQPTPPHSLALDAGGSGRRRRLPIGRSRPERAEERRAVSALRLLTPRGFVVKGLDPELLASLLQVLG